MYTDLTASCAECGGTGFVPVPGTASCQLCTCRIRMMPTWTLEAGGVPPRYLEASLETTSPENPAQAAAIVRLKHFASTWPERRRVGEGVALLGAGSRVGKTHLACALARSVAERYTHDSSRRWFVFINASLYISAWRTFFARPAAMEDDGDSTRSAEYNRLTRQERDAFRADLLILDELGEASGTEFVGQKLYTLIEHRVSNLLPIIFTSNLTWDGLVRRYGDDGARIVGRLQEISAEFTFSL